MAGYIATSTTQLNLAIGVQNLLTQSVLSYVAGQTIQVTFVPNPAVFLIGTIISYNQVTGAMQVNFTSVSGVLSIGGPWNTQPWNSGAPIFDEWTLTLIGGVPAPSAAPVAPSIIVRRLSASGDVLRGNGLANFLTDIDAVAQIIGTRIKLLQGEWFENVNLGTPMFQSILGHPITVQGLTLVMRQRILGTPFVTGIVAFDATYSAPGRTFAYQAVVSTQFGIVTTISGQ